MTGRSGPQEAERGLERLDRVRRALARTQPIIGRLASFLRLEVGTALDVAVETGAGHMVFDAAYLARADDAELHSWLAHAALHAALLHFVPPPGRPEAWSATCDAQVDRLLRELGLAPPGCLATERHTWWRGEVERGDEAARGRTLGGRAEGWPAAEVWAGEARLWRTRVRQAVGEIMGAGNAHSALLRELLGQSPDAVVHDWRGRLAAFLQRWHRAEAHYGRPSRRASEPFLLPALRPAAAHIVLAVDISASIDEALLRRFWAEVQGLAGQLPMRLTLLAADTRLAPGAPWRFAVGEVPSWPKPHGQGGTDFRPVFDWLGRSGEDFDALIYFTDGKGDYPASSPRLPVLWVVAGPVTPPFGEVIRL
ncbi:MAG: VWA-like domain-containing protein [Halothiobacillaceae bacterium]